MRKFKKVLYCILFVVLLAACGGVAREYMEKYDLGIRYLTEGNYEEAVLAFTAAIEIDDKLPDAFIGRGDAYVMWAAAVDDTKKEKNELALVDFMQAIGLDEANADIYLKAADVYIALDNMEAALELLSKGYDITKDERLNEMHRLIEERLNDDFFNRGSYIEFTDFSVEEQEFIEDMILLMESGNKMAVKEKLRDGRLAQLVKKYEDIWPNTLHSKNDKYKIRLNYVDYQNGLRFEIHPRNGMGYMCYYVEYDNSTEYQYIEGECSNYNWNGPFEIEKDYVYREYADNYWVTKYESGNAKDCLVHGTLTRIMTNGNSEKTKYEEYNNGILLSDDYSDNDIRMVDGFTDADSYSWWDWNK